MFYIGADLGTSAVKLLMMDENGNVIRIISKEYALSFPKPGWSEQNPDDWWEQTIYGLKELTKGIDKNLIAGISFGGQMHGLVILDKNDKVIRPAILWNDGRTSEETDYLNNVFGKEKLFKLTGNIAFAGFTLPKLLWLKKNEPDSFKKIHKIMLPKDYIAYRLTGVYSTDYSDASGMLLLDVENKCWSGQLLELCGLKEEQMPKLYESYEKTGHLLPDVAKELGFPESCIAAAGAGDNAAAAIGTGAVGSGKCNLSLGTSGTIFITTPDFKADSDYSLHSFAHADGNYHLMGCILSAASCNKWWLEDILKSTDYEYEQQNIVKLGENNIFFLPYLMGERSPHNNPKARGAFIGMSLDTKRTDMLQAVFEGVAYALNDCLEIARKLNVAAESATICGGGAKSLLWCTITANILNLSLNTVEIEEGPAYGAAILAAVANGEYATVEEAAARIVKVKNTIEPDKELVEKYKAGYQKYRKMYPALKDIYSDLCSNIC